MYMDRRLQRSLARRRGVKQSYEWLTAISRKSSSRSEFLDHDDENSLPMSVALHRG